MQAVFLMEHSAKKLQFITTELRLIISHSPLVLEYS